MKLEPAVKAETTRIAQGVCLCCCAEILLFGILHFALPAFVPLDYTVFLGVICGGLVAIANFFWMAVTVQQVAADPDPKRGRMRMQSSYSRRLLMQLAWVVLCLCLHCFHWIAGILPLFFPRVTIFLLQITGQYTPDKKDGET